jgi:hypothetical protein
MMCDAKITQIYEGTNQIGQSARNGGARAPPGPGMPAGTGVSPPSL